MYNTILWSGSSCVGEHLKAYNIVSNLLVINYLNPAIDRLVDN